MHSERSASLRAFPGRFAVTVLFCLAVLPGSATTRILRETFDHYPPPQPFELDALPPYGTAGHTNYFGEDALFIRTTLPTGNTLVESFVYGYTGAHFVADSFTEFRLDVLQFNSTNDFLDFGIVDGADYTLSASYRLLLNAKDLVFGKYGPGSARAQLLVESGAFQCNQVTLVLQYCTLGDTLSIRIQLLDKEDHDKAFLDRTVLDTPGSDPVFTPPPPFPATTADPGAPFLTTFLVWFGIASPAGTGRPCTAIFDNFQQTTTLLGVDELVGEVFTNATGGTLPYRLFVPAEYDPVHRYPLVLFLHGAGGNTIFNRTQVEDQPGFLAFASPDNQDKQPSFLVAPQTQRDWLTDADTVRDLLTTLQERYALDPDRFYVTGLSMGGWGTTDLLGHLTNVFAAAIPMSGASGFDRIPQLASTPMWAFCGASDTGFINNVRRLVDELRQAGAQPIYTEYKSGGHVIWTTAYQTPGLYDWLMAQRRGLPQGFPPGNTILTPSTEDRWVSWSSLCDLSGVVSSDVAVRHVYVWNLSTHISRKATGTNVWSVAGLPLRAATTNLVVAKAYAHSGAANLPGDTTFTDTLLIEQETLALEAMLDAGQRRLQWTADAPACVLQLCTDLSMPGWVDVQTNTTPDITLPVSTLPAFYRLRLLETALEGP